MSRSVRTSIASTVLALALLGVVWVVLAPTQLGGAVSYALIRGTSMEPSISRGDLVVLRRSDTYQVGDVAAYRSAELKRIVLHRIVDKAGERYRFKGDNNDFRDSEAPREAQLVGKLWFTVPLAGDVVAWTRVPFHAALVVGLLAVFALGGFGLAFEQRPRSRPAPTEGAVPIETVLLASGIAALLCALAVGVAFTRPVTERVAAPGSYLETGRFSYATPAPRGAVYPSGQVLSGDTVFVRLVPELPMRFAYRLSGRGLEELSGSARLVASLRGGNGWERRLLLSPDTSFTGARVTLRGTLHLRELLALGRHVQALTGTRTDGYALTVTPEIRIEGRAGDEDLRSRFAPALDLRLDEGSLRLDSEGADALVRTRSGSGTRVRAAAVSAFGIPVRIDLLRPAALAGLLIALVVVAWSLLAYARGGPGAEHDRIPARHRDSIVDVVGGPPAGPPRPVVEVASLEGLVRLAEQHGRVIMRERIAHGYAYLVEEDGVVYRHAAGSPAPPRPLRPAVVDDDAPTLTNIGG
jgi:signal peptidase I